MMKKYHSITHRILLSVLIFFVFGLVYAVYGIFFQSDTQESFLPALDLDRGYENDPIKYISGGDYSIGLNKTGQFLIRNYSSKDGVKLLYYINYKDNNGKSFEKLIKKFNVSFLKNDTLIIECTGESFRTTIQVKYNKGNKTLLFDAVTSFNNELRLTRSSLILLPAKPVNRFTKKNGMIEEDFKSAEYWIGRKGLIECGGKDERFTLEGGTLSSIQIETKRNEIWLNTDYYLDHPNIHILEDGSGSWSDRSENVYHKGDSVSSQFSIWFDSELGKYPRLMTNPNGYLSTIIFTEHADNTILQTNRAVYFGSDQVTNIGDATGGFIRYNIPVTKSIFFSNTEKLGNFDFNSDIKDLQLAVIDNPSYLEFLNEIYKSGKCEIALHTIDPDNDKSMMVDSAMSFLKSNFDITTWIDHGMSDGYSNRESFAADGLDSNSENYMSASWKKYGIKYFWNSAIEKERNCGALKSKLKNLQVIDFIRCYLDRITGNNNLLRSEEGEQVPSPIYWQNNYTDQTFYSWGTLRHSGHFPGWVWNYVYKKENLNQFVDERGINIIHFYPAFIGNKLGYNNGIVEKSGTSYIINDYFDKMLARLSNYRDNKKINITTIRDFMDYQLTKQNIEVVRSSKNKFKIYNRNKYDVKGISFVVDSGCKILINKEYNYKTIGKELIFWLDIGKEEAIEVEII